ncbi:MAG: hypothetical protein HY939_06340 [Gammaproteobacteria bacterium]|nr:hypothetical protein [Gammaproteobacteria bacterium]
MTAAYPNQTKIRLLSALQAYRFRGTISSAEERGLLQTLINQLDDSHTIQTTLRPGTTPFFKRHLETLGQALNSEDMSALTKYLETKPKKSIHLIRFQKGVIIFLLALFLPLVIVFLPLSLFGFATLLERAARKTGNPTPNPLCLLESPEQCLLSSINQAKAEYKSILLRENKNENEQPAVITPSSVTIQQALKYPTGSPPSLARPTTPLSTDLQQQAIKSATEILEYYFHAEIDALSAKIATTSRDQTQKFIMCRRTPNNTQYGEKTLFQIFIIPNLVTEQAFAGKLITLLATTGKGNSIATYQRDEKTEASYDRRYIIFSLTQIPLRAVLQNAIQCCVDRKQITLQTKEQLLHTAICQLLRASSHEEDRSHNNTTTPAPSPALRPLSTP